MDKKISDQLNLLATFHYIVGGIGVFMACLPLIHLTIGIAMLNGSIPMNNNQNEISPNLVGVIFIVMGSLFFVIGQCVAWLTIYSGKQIKARKKHTFSFVLGCVLCMFMPFGTILGVFTIILLSKQEVKVMYGTTTI
jgi:uncharacterized membrane protein YGL010W